MHTIAVVGTLSFFVCVEMVLYKKELHGFSFLRMYGYKRSMD